VQLLSLADAEAVEDEVGHLARVDEVAAAREPTRAATRGATRSSSR
jgi:hypothetical protein